MLHSKVVIVDDELWRGFVACRELVARKGKLRTPLSRALSQLYLFSLRRWSGGGRVGKQAAR